MTDRRKHEPEGEPLSCGHPTACLVYGGSEPRCGWCWDLFHSELGKENVRVAMRKMHNDLENELARLRSELEKERDDTASALREKWAAKDEAKSLRAELEEASRMLAAKDGLNRELNLELETLRAGRLDAIQERLDKSKVTMTPELDRLSRAEPVDNSGPFIVVRTPVMYQARTFGPPRVMTAEKVKEFIESGILVWELVACPTRAAAEAARRLLEMMK